MNTIAMADDAKRSVLKNMLEREFTAWFSTVPVDFWNECGAPAELAELAIKRLDGDLFPKKAAAPIHSVDLSFSQLVRVNHVRCHRWHGPDQRQWEPADWGNAISGESGELMDEVLNLISTALVIASKSGQLSNAVKKLQRLIDGHRSENDPGRHYSSVGEAKLAVLKEACDTIHYVSILAGELGLDLPSGMIAVFNGISERYGFPERLVPEVLVEVGE